MTGTFVSLVEDVLTMRHETKKPSAHLVAEDAIVQINGGAALRTQLRLGDPIKCTGNPITAIVVTRTTQVGLY